MNLIKHSLLFFFLLFAINCFSQTAIGSGLANKGSGNDQWDLNKYIWNHSQRQNNNKTPLDFNAIDLSVNLGADVSITRDGKFFAYSVDKGSRFDSVVIQSTIDSWRKAFKAFSFGFFSGDNKKYIFQDKEGLYVTRLGSNEGYSIKDVRDYKLPKNGSNEWLACRLKNGHVVLLNLYDEKEKCFSQVESYDFDPSGQWLIMESADSNTSGSKKVIIYSFKKYKEKRFSGVKDYKIHNGGRTFLLKTEKEKNNTTVTELQFFDLENDSLYTFFSTGDSTINIKTFCIDNSGRQVAFSVETITAKETENSLWVWMQNKNKPSIKLSDINRLIGQEQVLSDYGFSFSDNNRYILFQLKEKPARLLKTKDGVPIDVWGYKDDMLKTSEPKMEQLYYKAVIDIETGQSFRFENKYERTELIQGDYGVVCKSGLDEYADRFWVQGHDIDSNWLVSLQNSSRILLPLHKQWGKIWFSPCGQFLVYLNGRDSGDLFSYRLTSGKLVKISPHRQTLNSGRNVSDIVQWPQADTTVWVYDNYDIVQLDLTGEKAPVYITNGYGKKNGIIFSLLNNREDTLLLGAFNKRNKWSGFYRKIFGKAGDPELIYMGPSLISKPSRMVYDIHEGMDPLKAVDAHVWIIKKQTASDAPNYFVTTDFKSYRQLSNLQSPQNYSWLTSELHSFKQLDGTTSQGILYKPDNFDPLKKYPVIISFYTQLSDRLYEYARPAYFNQPIIAYQPGWLVSHGYIVFAPDIQFREIGWGPSTINTIDGAAKYLVSLPYIDSKSIGAGGHSNSGRFGYYLLTHSKSLAAISLGSGSTDMLGAAFGRDDDDGLLNWVENASFGGGLGKLWDNKAKWLDHTAILQADDVKSPALIFYNYKDWDHARQGRAMLTALRRLEKKAWWLQYDNGDHTLTNSKDKKDFTIRYTQFFDHYLKNAPAPKWMTQGIPYKLKGIEPRYELDASGNCGLENNKCIICNAWNEQLKRHPEMFEKPIADWSLDKDIAQALEKKENATRAALDIQGKKEQKKIVEILKNGYPEDNKAKLKSKN